MAWEKMWKTEDEEGADEIVAQQNIHSDFQPQIFFLYFMLLKEIISSAMTTSKAINLRPVLSYSSGLQWRHGAHM